MTPNEAQASIPEPPAVTQSPPITTPEEWARKAIDRIKGAKTPKELDDFTEKYHDKIAKLRLVVPDLHKQIIEAIQQKNMANA